MTSGARQDQTGGELGDLNARLETKTPQEILAWAVARFPGSVCLLSSMQRGSTALVHMLSDAGFTGVPVLFVDTGQHFPETLQTRDRLRERYGVEVVTVRPELTPEERLESEGCELWTSPSTYRVCCYLRKVRPFLRAAKRFDAVLSGLQRDGRNARSQVPVVASDPRIDAYVVHPLAVWSRDRLDAYVAANRVTLHPLYGRGYRSIGCAPCTTPARPGEDDRAGRWRHIREALESSGQPVEQIYCNINWVDTKGD